jgi:hypothetical protein
MNDRDCDAPDQEAKDDGEYRYLNGSPSDLCHLARPDYCNSGNGLSHDLSLHRQLRTIYQRKTSMYDVDHV